MRYAPDHKQETRKRVLTAAAKQLRERGPQGVAVATVMAEVGLTHGGFYAHFKSKDSFLSEVVEQMFIDSPANLLHASPEKSAQQILERFIDYYLSREHRDTRTGGCPFPFLAAHAKRLNDDLAERLATGLSKMSALVAAQLREIGHRDADTEASSCLSEVIGAIILARAERDPIRSDAILSRSRASIRHRMALALRQ